MSSLNGVTLSGWVNHCCSSTRTALTAGVNILQVTHIASKSPTHMC